MQLPMGMLCNCTLAAVVTSQKALPLVCVTQRCYSTVIAWGRNVEHQCGEGDAVVLQPVVVASSSSSMEGPLTSVHAGKQNSCFVSSLGTAWTWGCGRAGKLGHGSADSVTIPEKVEALFGRATVKNVALGEQHSLFLDARGSVWGCGEDKEGQCGLGASTNGAAVQQSQARQLQHTPRPRPVLASVQPQHSISRSLSMAPPSPSSSSSRSSLLSPPVHQSSASTSTSFLHSSLSTTTSNDSWMMLNGSPINMAQHLALRGLEPGQHHSPLRLGHRTLNHLFESTNQSKSRNKGWLDAAEEGFGLAGEEVTSLAASKYFSALTTARGEVWTFGACYNGALGLSASFSPRPTPVQPDLAQVIQAAGGAAKVVTAARCCIALLRDGRVLVWGKLSHGSSVHNSGVGASSSSPPSKTQLYAFVKGIPPISHIAAGQQHVLLSDGERVWSIGRWVDATGVEVGSSTCDNPVEVLDLQGESVAKLVAGPSSSAVVTDTGLVWMWGKVLDRHHAEGLARQGSRDFTVDDTEWQWAGLGSSKPARVPGLEGVKDLALGGWHVLALQG